MPLRFPEDIPAGIAKGQFDQKTGFGLDQWMKTIQEGLGGIQGTPTDPSEIQAGEASDPGESQAPAPSDHTHSVDTAAPSVPIALGGSVSEGTGTALMRADATNKLAQGGAVNNDGLVWDGSAWVPRPIGFSDSVLGQRAFAAMRPEVRPGAADSESVLANRVFSAPRPEPQLRPDDVQMILAGQVFRR